MGAYPSSIKREPLGKFFIDKPIVSQVPIYLFNTTLGHDKDTWRIYLSTSTPNDPSNSFIKLKPGIKFAVDDIISYCYNEGGVYTYDSWIYFLNEITEKDVLEINNHHVSDLEDVYNSDTNTFNMQKLNANTYTHTNVLINERWDKRYYPDELPLGCIATGAYDRSPNDLYRYQTSYLSQLETNPKDLKFRFESDCNSKGIFDWFSLGSKNPHHYRLDNYKGVGGSLHTNPFTNLLLWIFLISGLCWIFLFSGLHYIYNLGRNDCRPI
jgi:hypothetical protein